MVRGNPSKLKPQSERSPQEARDMGRKGGIASGEARRRKKTMREALEMLMFDTPLSEALKQRLKDEGVKEADMNHQMAITRSLIAKAEAGDVQAYHAICGMIGEKPADKMEVSGDVGKEVRLVFVSDGKDADAEFPSSEDEIDD